MSGIIENTAANQVLENGLFPSKDVMLDLKDLKKVYPTPKGDYVVLEDLNLQIRKEEFLTIIGHSGCGKTTMLSMIAGLNEISGGSISVLGKHIKGPGPDRGVIFQAPSLMPWMTSLQNVMLGVNKVFPHATKAQPFGYCKILFTESRVGGCL